MTSVAVAFRIELILGEEARQRANNALSAWLVFQSITAFPVPEYTARRRTKSIEQSHSWADEL